MNLTRIQACASASVTLALATATNNVLAHEYPTRPITVVIPQPAGSASDNVMRPIAQALGAQLGQPVVIENRPGAAGLIGMSYAARAKPDGYTLVVISNTTMAANPSLFKKLPYDPKKDFTPIALMGRTSMMFVVRSDFPAKSLEEFVTAAKQRKDGLSAGYGNSTAQVALNMLTTAGGFKVNPVPYQGTPKLMVDLIGGMIDMAVVDVGSGVVQARSGKVKPLAIAASRRLHASGNIPTMAEKYPGVAMDTWIALAAPAGTPQDLVDKLYQGVSTAAKSQDVRNAFSVVAIDQASATPNELADIIKEDQRKWPEMIRAAGIEPE